MICIGKEIILSAIGFFTDYNKLHKPAGHVQFVVFVKFMIACIKLQIAPEKADHEY